MNPITHNLSASDYHAIDAVSNSSLKWFRKSPAHYKAFLGGKIEAEPSKSQKTGTLVHSLVLEGKADFVTAPMLYDSVVLECKRCGSVSESATCRKCKSDRTPTVKTLDWNKNAKHCQEWEELQTLPVISRDAANQIRSAQVAIKSHPLCNSLLSGGNAEVSLFATCPKTGLKLKCRPDYLRKRDIIDLKTTDSAATGDFKRSMARYRYANQAAFYRYVATLLGMDIVAFYFIALELEPIPMPNVILLSEQDLDIATQDLHNTLEDLARCMETDEWRGYCGLEANKVTLPAYAHETGEEEVLMLGGIPI